MQVRMLKNIGTRDKHLPQLKAGEVFSANTDEAKKTCEFLIRRGLAEVIRAVPKEPTIKATKAKSDEAGTKETK